MDPKMGVPLIPSVDDVAVARPDAVPEVPVSVETPHSVVKVVEERMARAAAGLPVPELEGKPIYTYGDFVDHPHHYQGNGMESIDVIEAFDLDFCLGNTVKYVLRAGKKDNEIQDLKKAIWYLNRRIQQLEKANQ